MASIVQLISENGEQRSVEGNLHLPLDDPDGIWIVQSGFVDVFAVPVDEDGRSRARIHLCRVMPGQILCGSKSDSQLALQWIAVGLPGSEVIHIGQSQISDQLSGLGADPTNGAVAEFATLLETWIEQLTLAVSGQKLPHDAMSLNAGTEQSISPGATASPTKGVVWISEADGHVEFLSRLPLPSDFSTAAFPVSASGWIAVGQQTKLKTTTTVSLLSDAHLWAGLQTFHEKICVCIVANVREAALSDVQRLKEKAQAEQQLTQSALSQLATTVSVGHVDIGDRDEDPLLSACQLVGEQLGIAISVPKNYAEQSWSDPIDVIARASAIRIRRVVLAEGWHREDNGPLLGYSKETNRPVALLPVSVSRYEMVDSLTGARTIVTADIAETIQAFGHTFYRSFPSRSLAARDIFKFGLRGTARDWTVLIVLGVLSGLIGLLIPIATGWVIGTVIPAADQSRLLFVISALTVAGVVAVLFQFVQGVAMLRIETRMDCAVEAAVWDRLLNIPASFFRQYTSGDLAMRAMGISYIRQALTQSAAASLLTFFASFVYFGLLFYYDSGLALLAAALFVIIIGATCVSVYFQLPYEREQQHHRGRVWGIVLQLFTGVSRLRVAGAEERALAFWAGNYSRQTRASIQSQMVSNNLKSFMASLPIIAPLAIFARISFFPSENLSVGMFMAFYAAFTVIIMSALTMSGTISSMLDVIPLFERAKPILETQPEFDRGKRNPGLLAGGIEISHVSFRYQDDGPLILDDVSLQIQPGEYVAFVGPSGAGKSTILRLLLGFETPIAGSIYYDREELAGLDQLAVRRQIGVVLQDGKLTPGDILSNITGSAPLTLDDAWEAARLSGFEKDIKQMPMGMYTFLSDGESTLSGGQRQRLMIARAIVKKPKYLYFDEATSALDNVTQATVSQSLDNLKATRVVIAHRLSTVINADRIFVINRGKIEQQGSYHELIEQGGLFAALVNRQLL